MAKLKILPRSAEAELTAQVNSPVRPEGRTPTIYKTKNAFSQSFPEQEKLRLRRERVS